MKATKHYECGYIFVYFTGDDYERVLTFDNEGQMSRVGEILKDLARIGGNTVEITDKEKEI